MQATNPSRRRFRYSLATLFVVVTVVGCLAGWWAHCRKWIAERNDILRTYAVSEQFDAKAPGLLGLFGERGHSGLAVCFPNAAASHPAQHTSGNMVSIDEHAFDGRIEQEGELATKEQKELARIKAAFPEAKIIHFVVKPATQSVVR